MVLHRPLHAEVPGSSCLSLLCPCHTRRRHGSSPSPSCGGPRQLMSVPSLSLSHSEAAWFFTVTFMRRSQAAHVCPFSVLVTLGGGMVLHRHLHAEVPSSSCLSLLCP